MTQLAERPTNVLAQPADFNREQIDLIKATVAVGCTDLELALFLEVCKSTGLNPFLKQLYAIRRKTGREEKMTIQTGIDGYRLIAARTGVHLGTTDPEFGPLNKEGYPEWARVIARRLVQGHIAEFPATARWSEYVQTKNEWKNGAATGNKMVADMWARMPFTMLGKCAEALALRKSFPGELSSVYSDIEMQQADSEAAPVQQQQARTVDVTREVAQESGAPLHGNPDTDPDKLHQWRQKLKETCAKLGAYEGGKQAAILELKLHAWETSVVACSSAYEALKRIGMELKAQQEAAAQPNQISLPLDIDEPVEAEIVGEGITPARLRALQTAYSTKLKLTTPGERHGFAEWFLTLPDALTSTKNLTEVQATTLMDSIGSWDDDLIAQSLAEFRKWSDVKAPF